MRRLLSYFILILAMSSHGEDLNLEPLRHRVSASIASWPINPFLLDVGANYDGIFNDYWAFTARLQYEATTSDKSSYRGVGVQAGAKFMAWNQGERAFRKGIAVTAMTGFGLGGTWVPSTLPAKQAAQFTTSMPLVAGVEYMWTWPNDVFITGGIKSELFRIKFLKEIISYPIPRLEIGVGCFI